MDGHYSHTGPRQPEAMSPTGGKLAKLGWVWVAIGSAVVTAVVMYLIMQPEPIDLIATPPLESTVVDASSVAETQIPSSPATPSSPVSEQPSTPLTPSPSLVAPEFQTSMPVVSALPIVEDEWVTLGAQLSTPDDVWILDAAPEGFQNYASSLVGVADDDGCTPEISVYAMHPDGFVYGDLGWLDCGGGARIIWSDRDGEWAELFGFNGDIPCQDFADAGVPENAGELECFADGEMWYY